MEGFNIARKRKDGNGLDLLGGTDGKPLRLATRDEALLFIGENFSGMTLGNSEKTLDHVFPVPVNE